ncbi:MAG: HigA family addiction module antidote protein [Brasilonema octagenarum HA4186-MV1]|jgi:addiction module HigA family antidote|uniref:Addiction module antidote protein, HigA family n=2 Tax=Brasilonema TaxID=383614 RepID=A0A856MHS6_9CYAN|nr:HigA family addiction module antitoxin [Brasilonema sennae]MBW4625222.1 HigA family addiction module antidote protein [Brasilonema octagenarum HA4186-MV1]NMF62695.1 addiction module antidote protein, HigA family [Brasilonema octagenarum UFV-OR1]QDL10925.1 addiction module antidote protein, HigA family [Brasilonema sennae CENA114]QDL17271.1 addiction module antidote protein, HigA family [Brasilonema octagenarum UFV-E1]
MRIPSKRPPTHPGEILLKDFLEPLNLSQSDLANAIHVSYQRINELVNEKRGVTLSTALRLSKFFGNSSQFWLNLQQNWDMYHVLKEEEEELNTILQFKTNTDSGYARTSSVTGNNRSSTGANHKGKSPA